MKLVENYIWFSVVHENSLILKFEMRAPQMLLFWLLSIEVFSRFFSVVNMQFQNRELSKLTLAGPQYKMTIRFFDFLIN